MYAEQIHSIHAYCAASMLDGGNMQKNLTSSNQSTRVITCDVMHQPYAWSNMSDVSAWSVHAVMLHLMVSSLRRRLAS